MTMKATAVRSALVGLIGIFSAVAGGGAMAAGGGEIHIERHDWTFAGFRGQFDKAQLRRGFQVYQDVCAACHGLKRVYFRNLSEPGGPEFPVDSIKALAKEWDNKIFAGPNDDGEIVDDDGELLVRDPLLSDPILGPYANEKAARSSHNGALPPDLSLIIKSRGVANHSIWYTHVVQMASDIATGYQEGGADFVYALLMGYTETPHGMKLQEGMYYNSAFPGHQIAMSAPLAKDGTVEYQDDAGAKMSLSQNAEDVTAFLAWAGDPSLNSRKVLGWQVLLYLLITTFLLYLGKKRIWARVKH